MSKNDLIPFKWRPSDPSDKALQRPCRTVSSSVVCRVQHHVSTTFELDVNAANVFSLPPTVQTREFEAHSHGDVSSVGVLNAAFTVTLGLCENTKT